MGPLRAGGEMFDFREHNVIVTGGTSGIGAAVTSAFLEHGAFVTAIYGGDDAKADAFRAAISGEAAQRIETLKLDVSDYAAVEAFYHDYSDRRGEVWILVNNAGIRRDSVIAMMPQEDWTRVLDVNLSSVFNMTKFAVQSMMRRRWGRIVNVTSPSGKFGFKGQANYAASKAGMVAVTRSVSKEVATRGITVNAVSPGFIETGFISDLPEETRKAYRKDVPMNRFGSPAEVASCILFLASPLASYVTGECLEVTGGL